VRTLVIGTTNDGKVIEIRSGMSDLAGWNIETLPPSIPSIEETGLTFAENAAQKAVHFSRWVKDLTLGDDSGLCVDALGGRPGIHSARYAESVTARMNRLLGEMQGVPVDRRTASFVCALALARHGEIIWSVEKKVEGRIAFAPAGNNGFGYDPVFFMPDLGRTMAELSTEDKDRLSARGQAVSALRDFLKSL
jgi:XTP/dITP diphosphohydrolase